MLVFAVQHSDSAVHIHICFSRFFSIVDYSVQSVQFSCSVVSDSLRPRESQHARPPYHQLPEFPQTHVHRGSDAIQPFHPLSSPSPPAPNPSQHQSLFQWVNSSHEVAKSTGVSALASFLPKKSQGWSPSEWTGWITLQSKGLARVFSNMLISHFIVHYSKLVGISDMLCIFRSFQCSFLPGHLYLASLKYTVCL